MARSSRFVSSILRRPRVLVTAIGSSAPKPAGWHLQLRRPRYQEHASSTDRLRTNLEFRMLSGMVLSTLWYQKSSRILLKSKAATVQCACAASTVPQAVAHVRCPSLLTRQSEFGILEVCQQRNRCMNVWSLLLLLAYLEADQLPRSCRLPQPLPLRSHRHARRKVKLEMLLRWPYMEQMVAHAVATFAAESNKGDTTRSVIHIPLQKPKCAGFRELTASGLWPLIGT